MRGRREVLAEPMAHMRTAKRQEQSPAHDVPDVPRTTPGWRGRVPAEERCAAAHATGLTHGTGVWKISLRVLGGQLRAAWTNRQEGQLVLRYCIPYRRME